jgi:hypothetical protein
VPLPDPPDRPFEGNAIKAPEELWPTCDVCGVLGDPLDIEVLHRGCRFKALFPQAYEERDGMLFFDPKKMREQFESNMGGSGKDD